MVSAKDIPDTGKSADPNICKVVIATRTGDSSPWLGCLVHRLAAELSVRVQPIVLEISGAPSSRSLFAPDTPLLARLYSVADKLQLNARTTNGAFPLPVSSDSIRDLATQETIERLVAGGDIAFGINLGQDPPPSWLVNMARGGVYEVWSGSNRIGGLAFPFVTELSRGSDTVVIDIRRRTSTDQDSDLRCTSVSKLRSFAPASNARGLILRATDLLVKAMFRDSRLSSESQAALDSPQGRVAPATTRPPRVPTPTAANQRSPSLAGVRGFKTLLYRRFVSSRSAKGARWHLAFRRRERDPAGADDLLANPLASLDDLGAFDILSPPEGTLWADPFPAEVDGRTLVFFEEQHGSAPGHIACAELHADGSFSTPVTVLAAPTHLSYPHVFQWSGEWWMIPESADASTVTLYRASEFPFVWRAERELIGGVKLVDATPFQAEGKWWMFATSFGPDNFPLEDLQLYSARELTGQWTAHRANPIATDVFRGRSAGAIIQSSAGLIRPAQNGSVRYGYGLSFHRLLELNGESYSEHQIFSATPDGSAAGLFGLHTFNMTPSVVFVDLLMATKK